MKAIILSWLMVLLVASCGSKTKTISNQNSELRLLKKCWTHSFEENQTIYRPCDYTQFPSARFRQRFILEADGKASVLVLANNDAHQMVAAIWKFDNATNELSITKTDNTILFKKKIIELSEDKMLVE